MTEDNELDDWSIGVARGFVPSIIVEGRKLKRLLDQDEPERIDKEEVRITIMNLEVFVDFVRRELERGGILDE